MVDEHSFLRSGLIVFPDHERHKLRFAFIDADDLKDRQKVSALTTGLGAVMAITNKTPEELVTIYDKLDPAMRSLLPNGQSMQGAQAFIGEFDIEKGDFKFAQTPGSTIHSLVVHPTTENIDPTKIEAGSFIVLFDDRVQQNLGRERIETILRQAVQKKYGLFDISQQLLQEAKIAEAKNYLLPYLKENIPQLQSMLLQFLKEITALFRKKAAEKLEKARNDLTQKGVGARYVEEITVISAKEKSLEAKIRALDEADIPTSISTHLEEINNFGGEFSRDFSGHVHEIQKFIGTSK